MYEADIQKKSLENLQPTVCSVCKMSFANYSNRIRHEANIHGLKAPKLSKRTDSDSEQDESDNESGAPSSEEQSDIESEQEDNSDDEQDDKELEAWKFVMHQVLAETTDLPHNVDDILKPTTWNTFVLHIKNKADDLIEIADNLQGGEFYTELNNKIDKMEQNGYKNAAQTAWKKMKPQLKEFLLDNIGIVQEFFANENEDEEEQDMVQEDIA